MAPQSGCTDLDTREDSSALNEDCSPTSSRAVEDNGKRMVEWPGVLLLSPRNRRAGYMPVRRGTTRTIVDRVVSSFKQLGGF